MLDYQEKLTAAFSFLPGCRVTAAEAARVPGTVHVTFEGLASDEILFLLDQQGSVRRRPRAVRVARRLRATCSQPWA